jgi:hypothetical protein
MGGAVDAGEVRDALGRRTTFGASIFGAVLIADSAAAAAVTATSVGGDAAALSSTAASLGFSPKPTETEPGAEEVLCACSTSAAAASTRATVASDTRVSGATAVAWEIGRASCRERV